jgi:D-alanine-D-alanine ligase
MFWRDAVLSVRYASTATRRRGEGKTGKQEEIIVNRSDEIHIVIIMGGWSHEREVSMRSGTTVYNTIVGTKYRRRALQVLPDRRVKLLGEEVLPEDSTWDAVQPISFLAAFEQLAAWNCTVAVLALHGAGGEDGVIQGFLETVGMPYTHSDVRGSAAAMDKEFSKYIYEARGIQTSRYTVISPQDDLACILERAQLAFPVVAKPTILGSSFGVHIFFTPEELEKKLESLWEFDKRFILEEYIKGREFTCVILDRGSGNEPQALPVTEIVPGNSEFFDYEAKYTDQATQEITPAEIDAALAEQIQAVALASHAALKCSSVTRTDVIVSGENEIYVLETNTIPGMTGESLLPKAARAAGMSFSELLDIMIDTAIQNHGR